MSATEDIARNRPEKLNLPFGRGPADPGEWAYDHRVALCVTVIAYLVAGIVFMSSRIVFMGHRSAEAFQIEISDEMVPAPQVQMFQGSELTDVSNLFSNEGAGRMYDGERSGSQDDPLSGEGSQQISGEGLDSRIRDDRGTDAQNIYGEAAAAQARMAANRADYERGLRQVGEISGSGRRTESSGAASGDRKVAGKVTVSFSLVNPLRSSAYLHVPAYQCEGGGELVVAITVNRNGDVTAASVVEASASVDDCMIRTAESAARRSRFNIDGSAPEKHQGTITYIFIPQ